MIDWGNRSAAGLQNHLADPNPSGFRAATAPNEWVRAWCRRSSSASGVDRYEVLADGGLVRTERLARLEAALLIADSPVAPRRLAQVARLIDADEVRQLIEILNAAYDRDRSAFRIELTAGGYMMMTRAVLAPWLDRLHQRQSQTKLSQPAMETLTIIAYRQSVTRADVEAIRGVQSSEMIRQLIDRGLVRVAGEDDSLGRPFLYETTRQFLSMYGLKQISDLPDYEQLRRQAPEPEPATEESIEDEADSEDVDDELDDEDIDDESDDEDDDDLLTDDDSAAQKPAA